MDSGSLTADWTQAVIDLDLVRVQELYKTNPDLLWTPLDKECTNIEADYAHLLVQLEQVQVLGDDLEHLSAIPFTLLDHLETDDEEALSSFASQQKRARLLYFLIEVKFAALIAPFFTLGLPGRECASELILIFRMQMRTISIPVPGALAITKLCTLPAFWDKFKLSNNWSLAVRHSA